MGWLFCSDTRRALVQHLTENKESETVKWETLKHCTKGYGLLWTVSRTTNKETERSETYISCYLLRYSGGFWGYKDMCESMHPYQYSCPLSYLALAPVECEKWREGVRVYHEKAVKRRELKKSIRNHNNQVKEQTTMKNECLKTRPKENPYEVWQSFEGLWTWNVLKKWQADDNKPFARWFCNVISPFCQDGEMGDVYVKDIKRSARKVK